MWETQAGKFTTSKKVNIYFLLQEFSTTNIVAWKCHVEESNNSIYEIILCKDPLTSLLLQPKSSENVITGREGPY